MIHTYVESVQMSITESGQRLKNESIQMMIKSIKMNSMKIKTN